jgi:hypothetical protein
MATAKRDQRREIEKLAMLAREQGERIWSADPVGSPFELRPDGHVRLGGFCDLRAGDLADALQKAGFNAEFIAGTYRHDGRKVYHAWTKVDGELVIDITADQFDPKLPRVRIGTYRQLRNYEK